MGTQAEQDAAAAQKTVEEEREFKLGRLPEGSEGKLKAENARLKEQLEQKEQQLRDTQESQEMKKRVLNSMGLSTPASRRTGNLNVGSGFKLGLERLDEEDLTGAPRKALQDEVKLAEQQKLAQEQAKLLGEIKGYKPEKPFKFSGEQREKLSSWLYKTETYISILGFSTTKLGVQLAAQFLEGMAEDRLLAQQIRADRGEDDKIECWAEFKTFMLANFKEIGAERTALEAFGLVQQYPGSVSDFIMAFEKIMRELPGMNERDEMHRFLKGLLPSVGTKVREMAPTSVQMAKNLAMDVEANFAATKSAMGGARTWSNVAEAGSSRTWGKSGNAKLQALVEQLGVSEEEQLALLMAMDEGENRAKGKACFGCGGANHFRGTCPNRAQWKDFINSGRQAAQFPHLKQRLN